MKHHASERGSAIILALVIAIIAAGLAGAFMTLTTQASKTHHKLTESDEAQQICDAGVELARAALLKWRVADSPLPTKGMAPIPAPRYAWNKIFTWCVARDVAMPGLGKSANVDAIRADALARLNKPGSKWEYVAGNDALYNYDSSNISTSIAAQVDFNNPAVDACIMDLFGINRRYGKGALHLALRNDTGDHYGNGVDDATPPTGNPWAQDTPLDPTSDIIDGNGIAILIVTATLPDGTCHQIEATIGYPFPGGSKGAAIQANGDITMNGSFNVQGSLGSVQANGNISGNGSATATVEISVDASGSTTGLTMKNNPAKGINSGAAPLNIQPVDVGAFATDSKYSELQNRMWILNKDGTVAWKGGAGGGTVNPLSAGFTFKSGAWTMSGNSKVSPENAVYFIDGDFSMTGQGNAAPYTMTIIATGSVEMGGNAKFQPATKDGLDPIPDPYGGPIPTNTFGSLIVAGQDLSLRGTGSGGGNQYQGSAFANEQVEIKGNFTMNGSITAADATDTPGSKVSSSSSLAPDLTLGGNPTIIDNGTATIINSSPDHVNLLNLIRVK